MIASTITAQSQLVDADELSIFCEEIFASFSRADQRRWGEVYLRGLLSGPGRKSIRRISDQVVGGQGGQSLQQFVNQSPWRWDAVRSTLAHLASVIRPQAWLVQEVIFPKNGHNSVGVARQYAPSAGRTLNCQLGLAVVLANGVDRCVANWRLVLPRSWDDDLERRSRARIPVEVRHRPHWQYVFDAVDEMAIDWRLRPAPIVCNAVGQEATPLLRGLAARRLPYLVRVSGHTPVLPSRSSSGAWQVSTAAELADLSVSRRHVTLRVHKRSRRASVGSEYSLLSICDICAQSQCVNISTACAHRATRRVLAQWSWHPRGNRLTGVWLTNLTTAHLAQLVDLVELSPQLRREDMASLRDDFGLHDFEGRSYAGWHHHVTLVSVAHAYRMLRRRRAEAADPSTVPPVMSGQTSRLVDDGGPAWLSTRV
jgi:SRSO17 transposase